MSTVKDFRFPVSIEWEGGRMTRALADGKPELEVVTPPEFKHGIPGHWSPEELVVAAASSCYALTLAAVAERYNLVLHRLSVHGAGHVTRREDGRLGFVAIELEADVETDPASVEEVEEAGRRAKALCIVSLALDVPVHVKLLVSSGREHVLLGIG
jgi:organic hydroperoxide reductase OsmC/OhrA